MGKVGCRDRQHPRLLAEKLANFLCCLAKVMERLALDFPDSSLRMNIISKVFQLDETNNSSSVPLFKACCTHEQTGHSRHRLASRTVS
jgi:hypothetical protein